MDEIQGYLLWHARHLIEEDDGRIIHRDSDGSLHSDEEEWRLLGIYSTEQAAEAQLARARQLSGFSGEPDCFEIVPVELNQEMWLDGYFTYGPDGEIGEQAGGS
ncbi:hypothetical protein [Kitasatospora sp. NPDC085879]|uniref:hypothetical protein n=1 Tax=Kitasatospora sp. NPDC085879 TaxID=3154769 RepID=UPI000BCD9567|nr:hypothetical protein [Streptomyces sp. TLI_235]PBC70008.1 hypothetical protein BX265_7391 [Streptomyces sp. TLI_235]